MSLDVIRCLLVGPGHLPFIAATLILASWALYARPRRIQRFPLPPGPKPDPLIGHLRKVPTAEEHRVFAKWGRELNSDIISISVLGQIIVVLNSAKAANELLDRRSAIYSSRADLPMITYPDLVDWSKNTGMLPYGERWRSQRRMTHRVLHRGMSKQYWPLVIKQSRLALQRILTSPDNFIREIRRMAGSTMLSAIYGYEVTSAHDPLVEIVEIAVEHLCEAAIQGNFLVNVMPWLRHVPEWFPGTKWKQTVKTWREEKDEIVDVPHNWTKQQILNKYYVVKGTATKNLSQAAGAAIDSIVRSSLSELESGPLTERDRTEEEDKIKWAAETMFGAGADVTAASILVFILAMVHNHHVLAKAQAELDKIIGQDRLPEMSDRESLPYVECVMKEVMRWQPVTPTAVPHACIEDDQYNGYFIPKGATVIRNVWGISCDESVYPSPEQFNPHSFLSPDVPKPPAFGFGRRSCPGVHLAGYMLFITIATLLALFDIRAINDEQGNEIMPEVNMKPNVLVSYPVVFKCSITPRSEKAIQLLNVSAAGA